MLSDFSPESFSLSSTRSICLLLSCGFSDRDLDRLLPRDLAALDRDLDRFFSFLSFRLVSRLLDLLFFLDLAGGLGVLRLLVLDLDLRLSPRRDLERFLLLLLDFDRFLSTSTLSLFRSFSSTDFSLDLDSARTFLLSLDLERLRSFDLDLFLERLLRDLDVCRDLDRVRRLDRDLERRRLSLDRDLKIILKLLWSELIINCLA